MQKLLGLANLLAILLPPATESSSPPTPLPPSDCRSGYPLMDVYSPERFKILSACVEATGTVTMVYDCLDGDTHLSIRLDAPFRRLLNQGNLAAGGNLVAEIVAADKARGVRVPPVGTHARVVGPWVLDLPKGSNEIHPVWKIEQTTQIGPSPVVIARPRVPDKSRAGKAKTRRKSALSRGTKAPPTLKTKSVPR